MMELNKIQSSGRWDATARILNDNFAKIKLAIESGEGGGGGFDASTMWSLLANSEIEQISKSHLTSALSGYATQTWVNNQKFLKSISWEAVNGKPSTFTPSAHTHPYAGSSSAGGAATSALRWSAARMLTLKGALTGSASIDGSADVSIETKLPMIALDDLDTQTTPAYMGNYLIKNGSGNPSLSMIVSSDCMSHLVDQFVFGTAGAGNLVDHADTDVSILVRSYNKSAPNLSIAKGTWGKFYRMITVSNTTGDVTFDKKVTAASFVKEGGTASQFLKADGSVDGRTFLTSHQSLSGYATQSWVNSQGFLKSVPGATNTVAGITKLYDASFITTATYDDGAITPAGMKKFVEGKGYLTSHQSLAGYATQAWVNSQGFLKSSTLDGTNLKIGSIDAFCEANYGVKSGDTLSHAICQVECIANTAMLSADWDFINDKPSTFTPSAHTHPYAGSSSAGGAATSALRWSAARTLTLSGDLSGSASFDGSGNFTLSGSVSSKVFKYRGNYGNISGDIPTTLELAGNNGLSGNWYVQLPSSSGHLIQFCATGSTQYTQFYSKYSGDLLWRNSTDAALGEKPWRTMLDSTNYAAYTNTHKASYTASGTASARWIRIATFSVYNSYGIISIQNTYSNNAPNSVTFVFNTGYRSVSHPSVTQIGGRCGIFTKARVVFPTATNESGFIEVYYNTTSVSNTVNVRLSNSLNTTLNPSYVAGSVPDTHGSMEFGFTNDGISATNIKAAQFIGSLSGNATSASKWSTARTLTLTGSVTGSASIDGSGNVSLATTTNHGHAWSQITGAPAQATRWGTFEEITSKPINASCQFGGNRNEITTAQFITLLTNLGAFTHGWAVYRGSWSYANNQIINDTGVGNIHLAGSTVEVIGNKGCYTIRVTVPTTTSGGTVKRVYVYCNNGTDYYPQWWALANTSDLRWTGITGKPSWIGDSKPVYDGTELTVGSIDTYCEANYKVKNGDTLSHALSQVDCKVDALDFRLSGLTWATLEGKPSTFTPSAHTHTFASLSSKPTTLSGYGITDAPTKTGTGASGNWNITSSSFGTSTLRAVLENGNELNFVGTSTTVDGLNLYIGYPRPGRLSPTNFYFKNGSYEGIVHAKIRTPQIINTSPVGEAEYGKLNQVIVVDTTDSNKYKKMDRSTFRSQILSWSYNNNVLDLSGLDGNKWYPCTISLGRNYYTTIEFSNVLDGATNKPDWSTHAQGFTMNLSWEAMGGGWGATQPQRKILNYCVQFAGTQSPCGGIEQNAMASVEIVYLRGGAKYTYRCTPSGSFTVHSSGYSWSSGSYSYSAPVLNAPKMNVLSSFSSDSICGVYSIYGSYIGVNNRIGFRGKNTGNAWANIFNPLNACISTEEVATVSDASTVQPMLYWKNRITKANGTNVGYVTHYAIGSVRGITDYGKMVFLISNNDAGTAGVSYGFNYDGTVSVTGNYFKFNGPIKPLYTGDNSIYATIGPENGSYVHMRTNTAIGWYFEKNVDVVGRVSPYTDNAYTCGQAAKRWSNVYSVAMNATSNVDIGDARLYWDSANNAIRLSGTAGGKTNLCVTGGISTLGIELNSNLTARFDSIVASATIMAASTASAGSVVYVTSEKTFALKVGTTYYNNWPTADLYLKDWSSPRKPHTDKIYLCGDTPYVFNGTSLLASATQAWVTSRGYLTSHQSLAGYATQAWVNGKLNDYAMRNTALEFDGGTPFMYYSNGSSGFPFFGADVDAKSIYLKSVGGSLELGSGNTTVINMLGGLASVSKEGRVTATSFKKTDGRSTQFLKADGSVDERTFLTSVSWSSVTGKPSWIGTSKPAYNGTELLVGSIDTYCEANYKVKNGDTLSHAISQIDCKVDALDFRLSDAVTTNTNQDITGNKTFVNGVFFQSSDLDNKAFYYNGRIAFGGITARGVNVGSLLISDAWKDVDKLEYAGLYAKGPAKVKNLVIHNTDGIAHIQFSRGGFNYFAAPESGYMAFVPSGKTLSQANSDLVITDKLVFPGTNDLVWLGNGIYRWHSVCSYALDTAGTNPYLRLCVTGKNPYWVQAFGDYLYVGNGTSKAMILDTNGNVLMGAGSVNSNWKLQVNGNSFINGNVYSVKLNVSGDATFNGSATFSGDNTFTGGNQFSGTVGFTAGNTNFVANNSYGHFLHFGNTTSPVSYWRLYGNASNGHFVIRRESMMVLDLFNNGNAELHGTLTQNKGSDIRLKKNLDYGVDYAERLLSLGRICDYEYNDLAFELEAPDVDHGRHTGLIYQKVKTVLPQMARMFKEDYGCLDYTNTDYINLIAGATQLNTLGLRSVLRRTETLEDKVSRLEEKVRTLERKISENAC